LRHTNDIVVFNECETESELEIFEAGILVQGSAGAGRKQ
jgi:hypothetical protein